MNILLVNRWYPPYTGNGGVAAYDYYLAHALQRQGHEVSIIAARWSKADPEFQNDGGIKVVRILAEHHDRLHRLPFLGRYMRPLFQWLYSLEIAKKIHEKEGLERFDLIEIAEVNGEGYTYLHRRVRLPVVVRCHTPMFVLSQYYNPNEINYDTGFTTKMEKYCIRASDALTAPSTDMARVIERSCILNEKSITVIPNPLDLSIFSPAQYNTRTPSKEIRILHVGRLERVKGVEILIRAASDVISQFPTIRFILAGGGSASYLDKLHQLIGSLEIRDDCFQFLGDVSQEELIEWYQKADIAVVPTLNYESFSYTVAQAMASGLPVVTSRIGGIPATVGQGEAAILVELGNIEQLAEALIALCRNPSRRQTIGAAARIQAESYFSDDVVAEKMALFYQSVVE